MATELKSTVRMAVEGVFNGALSDIVEQVIIYTPNDADAYDPNTGEYTLPREPKTTVYNLPVRNISDDSYGFQVLHIDAIETDLMPMGIFMLRNFEDKLFIGVTYKNLNDYNNNTIIMKIRVDGGDVYTLNLMNVKHIPDDPVDINLARTTENHSLDFDDWESLRPWGNVDDFVNRPAFYYYIDDDDASGIVGALRGGTAINIEVDLTVDAYDPEYHNIPLNGIFTEFGCEFIPDPIRENINRASTPLAKANDLFIGLLPFNISDGGDIHNRIMCANTVIRSRGEHRYIIKSFTIDPTETICEMILESELI